jgi:hypothetical protein
MKLVVDCPPISLEQTPENLPSVDSSADAAIFHFVRALARNLARADHEQENQKEATGNEGSSICAIF